MKKIEEKMAYKRVLRISGKSLTNSSEVGAEVDKLALNIVKDYVPTRLCVHLLMTEEKNTRDACRAAVLHA